MNCCLAGLLYMSVNLATAQQSAKDWYAKGLNADEHTQKLEYFSKAIELDEAYLDAYNARAIAKSDLGMLKEAILDFNLAVLIDSTNVFAFYNRASCQFALNKYEEAIKDFDQVIKLKPAHAYAMSGKGCALLLQGKPEEALLLLNKALWLEGSLQSALKCREEALKQGEREPTPNTAAIKTPKGKPVAAAASTGKTVGTDIAQPLKITIAPSIGTYKLVNATSLREGPVHTTRVLLRFTAGNQVEVLEKTDDLWWKVRFKGKVGYAKAAMLATVN
jgi:tetratricopeptide (TPR) repeat protein